MKRKLKVFKIITSISLTLVVMLNLMLTLSNSVRAETRTYQALGKSLQDSNISERTLSPNVITDATTDPNYDSMVNLALNKSTATSGLEVTDGRWPSAKITDGNTTDINSRWSSAFINNSGVLTPQWVSVDLGTETIFDKIKLFWQAANATIYQIQTSNNNIDWTQVYRNASGTGGVEVISLDTKQTARYIRLYCEKNNSAVWHNVSLYEMEVYSGKLPITAQTIDEVIAGLRVNIASSDTTLKMPVVPPGFEIKFIGADYKQIIGNDLAINKPLVDSKVIVDFEVKKGTEKKNTSGIEITVPGQYQQLPTNNSKPSVIPELREWAGKTGNFQISDGSRIVVNPADEAILIETAKTFAQDYKDILGKEIQVVVSTEANAGDFYLSLGTTYPSTGNEGYYMDVNEKVLVEGNNKTGVLYATRSILQILKQTKATIPMGLVKDYPRYEVRGFMLDVGRKAITMDFLKEVSKTMAWYKLNDFQVHLNDNYIWLHDDYPTNAKENAYAGFRLESNDVGANGVALTSKDLSYTKAEFGNFIDYSNALGVNIVPEIDSPGHALAFTKVHPDYAYGNGQGENAAMLNVSNPVVVDYIKGIFNEYTDGTNPVFRNSTVHVGSDEFYGGAEEYRLYTDKILKFMRDDKKRTTRVWGSLSSKTGTTPVTSSNIEMNIWNTGWANPLAMYKQGYKIINTDDAYLYIVPGANYYRNYLDQQWLYNNWEVNKFSNGNIIPAGSEQMIGGMFALWNDLNDKRENGATEFDLFDRILPATQALSEKMWGRGKDKTYDQFKQVASKVSLAPNTNPTYTVKSLGEKVVEYKLDETISSPMDTSGNNYNVIKSENVSSVNGKKGKAIELKGGASYIQSPLTNLGPNYTVSMFVKRDATSGTNEQILLESSKGSFKAVQKVTGKVGFTREFVDFSFNYELPKDVWTQITIVGEVNKTSLYVNGEYTDEISKAGSGGKYGTFILPLETIGSKTSSFKGIIDEVVVTNTKTIKDETIIPQSQMSATTTSFQANTVNEGEAKYAIDGNEGSIWHTNWNQAVLPQSITLALGGSYEINKFSYLPRQSGTNGIITQYEISTSIDGINFTKVSEIDNATAGTWANNNTLKRVKFTPVTATHVRLTAKAAVGNFASAAEVNVHKVIKDEVVENIIVSKVENLKSAEITQNTVNISWDEPISIVGLKEYIIYKDGKEVGKVPATTKNYTILGLRSNTIYGLKVTAKYSNGLESKPQSINIRTKAATINTL